MFGIGGAGVIGVAAAVMSGCGCKTAGVIGAVGVAVAGKTGCGW